jgi:Sideroflexins
MPQQVTQHGTFVSYLYPMILHDYLRHLPLTVISTGVTNEQLGVAYVAATTASVGTALGFNRMIASRPALAAGIVGRLVPLVAVAAANCVNIPLMVRHRPVTALLKNSHVISNLLFSTIKRGLHLRLNILPLSYTFSVSKKS